MRNLSLVSRTSISADPSWGDSQATCADVDENILYGASLSTVDGPKTVTIWRERASSRTAERIFDFSPETSSNAASIISLHIIAETRQICVILGSGDIAVAGLDETPPQIEVVGSFDSGILSASWSPDDSFLILVNGDKQLLQMTRDFEVLYEAPLSTSEFGEDQQNALGWGSKSTQFHGSLGKNAATAPSTPSIIGSSPYDDKCPRISWRGDTSFFSVSSLESVDASSPPHRIIRVYSPSPELTLHSTIEATAGLEHQLAWNASGSLIASTQRYGTSTPGLGAGREGRHDVVFFERNGLKRSSFEVVKGGGLSPSAAEFYEIRELAWSCDSSILAVWIRMKDQGDVVQLWTIGNYHWYLKQSIRSPSKELFTSISWHPEHALQLTATTCKSIIRIDLAWTTCSSPTKPPNDTGTVVVVDGENALVTPFRVQNIPPPMCSITLPLYPLSETHAREVPRAPIDLCLAPHRDLLAVLHSDETLTVWDLSESTLSLSHIKSSKPTRLWDGDLDQPTGSEYPAVIGARQIVIWRRSKDETSDWAVAVLASDADTGCDVVVINGPTMESSVRISSETKDGRLFVSTDDLWLQSKSGSIHHVNLDERDTVPSLQSLPSFCLDISVIKTTPADSPSEAPSIVLAGLTQTGKLLLSVSAASQDDNPEPIATNATSFTITPSYLTYTTTAHEAHFVPTDKLVDPTASSPGSPIAPSETRRVERGSRIVVAVPSAMSLVLQMPRGNLETISPRPFVLEVVRADVANSRFRKAFLACRKHRVDLNLIVDYGSDAFMDGLGQFIEQIPEVDHLNLFLASIGRSTRPPAEINRICDTIRTDLERRDLKSYVNSILTAHVVKSPPDLEAALRLLAQLQSSNPDSVEDAVKYIIFLVDSNTLFDTALGMYDFPLTLLIAQHSQRDPREYIPFLRELRTLPAPYQRFAIDDHLKRHSKALFGLRDSGDEKFDEAVQYIEKHRLFTDSLDVWKSDEQKHTRLLEVYGDYLYERRDFEQSALAFSLGTRWRKALLAYEKAHMWKEAFALTSRAELTEEEVSNLASRIADDLNGRKRHLEAARVLFDYGKDLAGGLAALVQGNDVSEALRVITMHNQPELLEQIVQPGMIELREELGEEIREAEEQLSKQAGRYRELQIKKAEAPEMFYMEDDPGLHNVDMMTDAGESVVSTAFTRYTVAPSTSSKVSKTRTNKSKKQARKKGKKGTVDEEEYIIASFIKMVPRLEHLETECSKLLPHLFIISEDLKGESSTLLSEIRAFQKHLLEVVGEVWPEQDADQLIVEPKPKKPTISSKLWSSSLYGGLEARS